MGPGARRPDRARPRRRSRGASPGYRADAQVLAQDLFPLGPNLYTQFLYFALGREPLPAAARGRGRRPSATPTPAAAAEASRRRRLGRRPHARRPASGRRSAGPSPRAGSTPSRATGSSRPRRPRAAHPSACRARDGDDADAGARGHGRLLPPAGRDVPASARRRSAASARRMVPTTLEEWEPGDPSRDIDWLATLLQRGRELGAALPLKRHQGRRGRGARRRRSGSRGSRSTWTSAARCPTRADAQRHDPGGADPGHRGDPRRRLGAGAALLVDAGRCTGSGAARRPSCRGS